MRKKGFTLIEILVALGIVSVALIALIKAQSQHTQNLAYLEQKTMANLVASNLAVENRLKKQHSIGFSNGNYILGHQTWYWQSKTNPTADSDILKQSLQVFVDKKSRENKQAIAQLTLFLRK